MNLPFHYKHPQPAQSPSPPPAYKPPSRRCYICLPLQSCLPPAPPHYPMPRFRSSLYFLPLVLQPLATQTTLESPKTPSQFPQNRSSHDRWERAASTVCPERRQQWHRRTAHKEVGKDPRVRATFPGRHRLSPTSATFTRKRPPPPTLHPASPRQTNPRSDEHLPPTLNSKTEKPTKHIPAAARPNEKHA